MYFFRQLFSSNVLIIEFKTLLVGCLIFYSVILRKWQSASQALGCTHIISFYFDKNDRVTSVGKCTVICGLNGRYIFFSKITGLVFKICIDLFVFFLMGVEDVHIFLKKGYQIKKKIFYEVRLYHCDLYKASTYVIIFWKKYKSKTTALTYMLYPYVLCIFHRDWRKWEKHLHQTNENYPWIRVLQCGPKWLH